MNNTKVIIVFVLLIIFLFSGCSNDANTTDETVQGDIAQVESNDHGPKDQPNDESTNSQDNLVVNGIVQILSDNEITIAVNPILMPVNGGNMESGPGNSYSNHKKPPEEGTHPTNTKEDNEDNLSPGSNTPPTESNNDSLTAVVQDLKPDQPTSDISEWEEVTYQIDNQTVIVEMTNSSDGTTGETEINTSELSQGDNVTITLRSDAQNIIDKIVLMDNKANDQ